MTLLQSGDKRPKVLFAVDNYFKNGTLLDATRRSFTLELAKYASSLTYYQANDDSPEEAEVRVKEIFDSPDRPDIILTINAAGLSDALADKASSCGVPIVSWFFDSTRLVIPSLIKNARKGEMFYGCDGFDSIASQNTRARWVPFSTIPAVLTPSTATRGIGFLGTCWHVTRVAQALSIGLYNTVEKKHYFGSEIYERFQDTDTLEDTWQTSGGKPVSVGEVLNMFASIKRTLALSWFSDFDLHIYGDASWATNLWPTAPQLIPKTYVRYAVTHEELRTLMREHHASLNIFHPHNLRGEGGANLRIFDSATHGVAILSEANPRCQELFPEGEAALYFKDAGEGQAMARELLSSVSLREKLVKKAAEIVNDGHTHAHRIKTFFQCVGITVQEETPVPIRVLSKHLPSEILDRTRTFQVPQVLEDPRNSRYVQIEKYYFEEQPKYLEHYHKSYEITVKELNALKDRTSYKLLTLISAAIANLKRFFGKPLRFMRRIAQS